MIRPARFDLLPRLRRADCTVLRQLRAQLGTGAAAALHRWAEEHLGGPDGVGVRARPCGGGPEQQHRVREAAAMVVRLQGPDARRAILALDARSVATLVALLLRTAPQASAGPPSPAEQALVIYALAGLLLELEACAWTIVVGGPAPLDAAVVVGRPAPLDAAVVVGGPARLDAAVVVGGPAPLDAAVVVGGPAPLDAAVVVELELALRGWTGLGWLLVEEAALAAAAPVDGAGRTRPLGRLAGLRLTLPVELGRLRLPASELALLGAGDVIVSADCPRRRADQPAVLRVGAGGFAARVDERTGQVRVGAPYCRGGGFSMGTQGTQETQGTQGAQGAEHQSRLADDLPVELVVEVGRLQLTGAQVLELGPGDVLTLGRSLGPVELRVGDRLIGRAELVDVEGEAGVRLSELYD